MPAPVLALKTRLEDIIRRHPVPATPATRQDDLAEFFRHRSQTACDQRFPARYREASLTHPEITAWANTYRANSRQAPWLLLLGPTGVGKTHHAYAALRAAVHQPAPVSWEALTAADLYANLRPRPNADTETDLTRYRTTGLLLIDDLGAAKPSEWTEEITYRILNTRYNQQLPVIATTNLSLNDFKARLGDRITSRLAETCTRIVLAGTDRRRQPPQDQP